METQTGLFAEHDTRYTYLCMHDNFLCNLRILFSFLYHLQYIYIFFYSDF